MIMFTSTIVPLQGRKKYSEKTEKNTADMKTKRLTDDGEPQSFTTTRQSAISRVSD